VLELSNPRKANLEFSVVIFPEAFCLVFAGKVLLVKQVAKKSLLLAAHPDTSDEVII
jgi:hypothetical protein